MGLDAFIIPKFPMAAFDEGISGIGDEELRAQICKACLGKSFNLVDEFLETFWEGLPNVFDLGTWEDVKTRSTLVRTPLLSSNVNTSRNFVFYRFHADPSFL